MSELYIEFLKSKIKQAGKAGLLIEESEITPIAKPHQRDVIQWAGEGGRRAIFLQFGLGKTLIQCELARIITQREGGRFLIVCPLGVKQEFSVTQAEMLGMNIPYVKTTMEVLAAESSVVITNYERIRDGQIDVEQLIQFNGLRGVSLDEGDVLRSLGSDTTQQFINRFRDIKYKFVCTATPSPNEYLEIINYADFLGIMDRGQALTRFFQRNSQKAGELTIHPQHEKAFWLWVSSWAIFLNKPSDLGYSDEGYDLPPLEVNWHCVKVDPEKFGLMKEKDGQVKAFADSANSLPEAAKIKRASINERLEKAMQIMEVPHPDAVTFTFSNGDERELVKGARYYYSHGLCAETFVLQDWCKNSVLFLTEEGKEHKVTDNVFSDMLLLNDSYLLWHLLEDERKAIERQLPFVKTVYGTQNIQEREQLILDFSEGKYPILATKPEIAGSGCNFQRHCNRAIFMSIDYKFKDFIQAIHRIHRFMQNRPVVIDIIYTEQEESVKDALIEKWDLHNQQQEIMSGIMREYGLDHSKQISELHRSMGCERFETVGENFVAINNDSCIELPRHKTNSVGLIHTSIPFGNHYEYSASYNDFGHNDTNAVFWKQMDFLIPDLLRVLKPGRNAIIHVKDRIRYGTMTGNGMTTLDPFSDECVSAFRKHGFLYMGRITIVTDVVRENNQTYRLGHSEKCKDATKMGCGLPEYLLIFRKAQTDKSKGYADEPVVKDKSDYGLSKWQTDASAFWRSGGNRLLEPADVAEWDPKKIMAWFKMWSVNEVYDYEKHVALAEELAARNKLSKTFSMLQVQSTNEDAVWTGVNYMIGLNAEQRANKVENHICPLPFDIVNRVIECWSMEGDTVLDPFGGLMTVPMCAIKKKRKAIGIELNNDYYRWGCGYLRSAEIEMTVPTLFDLEKEAV